MWGNSLKLAYRKLRKQRSYSIINILGLAIGLSSFMVIGLYVLDEFSYDRYHKNSDRIFRLNQISNFAGNTERSSSMPFPFAEAFKESLPDETEQIVRFFNFQTEQILIQNDFDNYNEYNAFFADSNIFKVFDFEFLYGDINSAMNNPNSIVMSETAAFKYFGKTNAIGDTLKIMAHQPVIVTGVFKNQPIQSHFTIDVLIPFSLLHHLFRNDEMMKGTVWNPCWTYVLLKEGINPDDLEPKIKKLEKSFWAGQDPPPEIKLQELTSIHLHSNLDFEIEANSDYSYVLLLSSIAIFLLLISLINFINITTAYSTMQEREIGIKKVIGAERKELIIQFISEATIISLVAFIISLALTELILPLFNALSHKDFSIADVFMLSRFIPMLFIVLLSGIISGLFPAIRLSDIKPVPALRSPVYKTIKRSIGRKTMVLLQFSISISLIIITFIILDQIRFIRNSDLGFNKENVIMLPTSQNRLTAYYEGFKSELLRHDGIKSVTGMDYIIGVDHNNHEFVSEYTPKGEFEFFPALLVQEEFIETFEIEMLAGEPLTNKNKKDGILINESLARHLNYIPYNTAIGKQFSGYRKDEKIVGVYKDFHVKSLRQAKTPFILDYRSRSSLNWIAVKIDPNQYKQVIEYMNEIWDRYSKERPFQYLWLADELEDQYKDDETLSVFSLIFSIINIIIAGIGLFGLTSFITDQRTREIGIRKALGASVARIIMQLSKDYVMLILAANIIAWPLSFLILRLWLRTFEYHAMINPAYFVLSAFIAVILAVSIIGYRALKSARTNPGQTLKYE